MAIKNWNNNASSFGYDAWTGTANLGVNLARQKNAPLDISGVFSSKVDMLYYVTEGRFPTGGTGVADKVKDMTKYPYLGQIIALVDTDLENVEIFYIKTAEYDSTLTTEAAMFAHYFEEVGKATTGDNKSIVLNGDDGILYLKDFGKKYYKFVAAVGTEGSEGYVAAHYTAVVVDDDNPWIPENLELAVDSTGIIWRERNTSTVEGAVAQIASLKEAVDALSPRVTKLENDFEDLVPTKIQPIKDELDAFKPTVATLSGGNTFTGDNTFNKPVVIGTPTADNHATTKSYVDNKVADLGSVFELKAVLTEEEFTAAASSLNTSSNTYVAGDVVLVKITDGTGKDINKEYVVVSETVEGTTTLRFELLGDPSGVTTLAAKVEALEAASGTHATKADLTAEEAARNDADAALAARILPIENYKIPETYATKADLTAEEAARNDADAAEKKDREDAVTGLSTRLDSVEKTLGEGTTTTLIFDVESLKKDNGENKTAIESLTKDNGENKTAIESLTKDNATNKNDIKDLKAKFTGSKANEASVADVANKVAKSINIFGKTFDGSAEVTIEKSDVVGIATTEVAGTVKSASGDGKVTVAEDGTMSVSKVTEAAKVTGTLTAGKKSFNGSANVTIDLTDLGFDANNYATAAQGNAADTAVQKVTFNGTDKTGKNVAITAEEVKTAVGIADYVKTETMTAELTKKANKGTTLAEYAIADAFTKTEINAKFDEVNTELAKKLVAGDAMRFKGLLGAGEIEALPTEGVVNGDTYKVITSDTYNGQNAQVGDMFIAVVTAASEGQTEVTISWVLVPSGDDGNVYHSDSFDTDQLVVGSDPKTVKKLAAGANGQILKMVNNKPTWSDDQNISMTSSDNSIEINNRDLKVRKVNCNLLEQTEGDYLIFDCGSSTVNI